MRAVAFIFSSGLPGYFFYERLYLVSAVFEELPVGFRNFK